MTTLKLRVDQSGMVYSPSGSLDLFLILGCLTCNLLVLGFFHLAFLFFLWGTNTSVFARLNTCKAPISYSSSSHGFIMNQFNDLLPVGLLAQLVERCTSIAEVKGLNPVKPEYFSGFLFATAKVPYITAMIIPHLSPHPYCPEAL